MMLMMNWILVIVVEVQFAMANKIDTIQTAEYKTKQECEYAKKKLMDAFPEKIDEAWCEHK